MKKFLVISGIGIPIVLLGCFLVINTGFFVKRVVIPLAASSLGTDITVDDVDFSIFKGFQLINLKVEADGDKPPPLNADIARIRYRFIPLLKGKVQVDEVVLENVSIHILEDKNGVLNIPSSTSTEPKTHPPKMDEKEGVVFVPQFEIRNIKINNLSLVYEREASDHSPKVYAGVSNFTFSLDTLAPGESFQIDSQFSLNCKVEDQVNASSDQCKLTAKGLIREDYFPGNLNLTFTIDKIGGNAGPVKLDDRVVNFELNCEGDGEKYQLKRCEFSEAFQGNIEGQGSVSGEFGIHSASANMELEMKTVGPGFLNLVGGMIGDYNFGNTEFQYTADLKVRENASSVTAIGNLEVTNFSVKSESLGISGLGPLNSSFAHNITFEQEGQFINLQKVNLLVADEDRDLITLTLSEPTMISLKQTKDFGNKEATLNLAVKDFNLEFIKPLIPGSMGVDLQHGILNKVAEFKIYEGGNYLELKGNATLRDLSFKVAGNEYTGLELKKSYSLSVNDFFSELIVDHLNMTGFVNEKMIYDFNALASINIKDRIGTAKIGPLKVTPEIGSMIPDGLIQGTKLPISIVIVFLR